MRFGPAALPFPWTLGVRGVPYRFGSKESAVRALSSHLQSGTTNVDCGLMQINWRWHREKFATVEDAIEPYINLTVGAFLLKKAFASCGDWFAAVGKYHNESDVTRARRYATSVFNILQRMPA